MTAYYNEWEPYAAAWLRNLISAGHLPPGDVDERSITEVKADDLKNYKQCHFFAGIGGWAYALRIAGWPDDRPVWTGSCPCQPFSAAGKQDGHGDERHLWPHWFRLIRERRPATVFGEQVAGAIAFGWLDEVFYDLEKEAYACAAALLPACAVGAPHKRERLWFMANADSNWKLQSEGGVEEFRGWLSNGGAFMANADSRRGRADLTNWDFAARKDAARPQANRVLGKIRDECAASALANADSGDVEGVIGKVYDQKIREEPKARPPRLCDRAGQHCGWEAEPSLGRVAHGIPCRVGRLRAYGNAIVPQVAAEFIKAAMEIEKISPF